MPETIEKSLKEKVLQIKQHMKQFQSKNSGKYTDCKILVLC